LTFGRDFMEVRRRRCNPSREPDFLLPACDSLAVVVPRPRSRFGGPTPGQAKLESKETGLQSEKAQGGQATRRRKRRRVGTDRFAEQGLEAEAPGGRSRRNGRRQRRSLRGDAVTGDNGEGAGGRR
jgi:hypothetical protein